MVDLKAWVDVDEEELGINEKVYIRFWKRSWRKIPISKRSNRRSNVTFTT